MHVQDNWQIYFTCLYFVCGIFSLVGFGVPLAHPSPRAPSPESFVVLFPIRATILGLFLFLLQYNCTSSVAADLFAVNTRSQSPPHGTQTASNPNCHSSFSFKLRR